MSAKECWNENDLHMDFDIKAKREKTHTCHVDHHHKLPDHPLSESIHAAWFITLNHIYYYTPLDLNLIKVASVRQHIKSNHSEHRKTIYYIVRWIGAVSSKVCDVDVVTKNCTTLPHIQSAERNFGAEWRFSLWLMLPATTTQLPDWPTKQPHPARRSNAHIFCDWWSEINCGHWS